MTTTKDHVQRFVDSESKLVLVVAYTTRSLQALQKQLELAPASTLALGRLLTATALVGLTRPERGDMSMQLVGDGDFGQMFADVTDEGNMRGYIKNRQVHIPLNRVMAKSPRVDLSQATGQGDISVIKMPVGREFTQSMTPITDGNIDSDIAAFVEQSDQIPTAIACDATLEPPSHEVQWAGGIMLQALPDTELSDYQEARKRLLALSTEDLAQTSAQGPLALAQQVSAKAQALDAEIPVQWHCRCSYERVVGALRMLNTVELADMVSKKESPEVTCDFCLKKFVISPEDVAAVYQSTIVDQN